MQRSIILLGLGLAALTGCNDSGMGVAGVAEAQSSKKTVNLRVWGSQFISSDDGSFPTPIGESLTLFGTAKTRGSSGSPLYSATSSIRGIEEWLTGGNDVPPECLEAGLLGAPFSQTIVLNYNDGSLLSLIALAPDLGGKSFYCLDPETGTNFIVGRGSVAAGDGRFEGATGTYEFTGELLLPLEAGLFRGDLIVDFK